MINKIKICLIGCGRVTGHHIKAIKKSKKYHIAGVCDLNVDKANYYGKKFNISSYSNYYDMLDNEDCDVVSIMTPSGMHYEHSNDIIKKYKKNIVIEKPI